MRIVWIISSLFLIQTVEARAKEWKVFCMPNKHLDVGWAYLPQEALEGGYPGSVEDMQNVVTLRALMVRKLTERHSAEARYHWFFDAAWQLEQASEYLPDLMGDIRRLVNSGDFGYNPIFAHLHSMYLTNEQLMRMMDCARALERQGFRRSDVAVHTDVPTVSWGYASVLASAGVKCFLKGTWFDSPYSRNLAEVAPAPLFRWTGPDGRKVLFFYYDDYSVMTGGAGAGRRYESLAEEVVQECVGRYEKLASTGKWPYDAIPMFGSEGDWGMPDRRNSDFIRDWNKSHAEIQLRMATPEDFFEYIEANFADRVPDGVSGGWGVSYDLVEGNAVKPGAKARRNDHLLLAAESFGAIANLRFGTPYPTEPLRQAWKKQVLYHEHSFGMRDGAGPKARRQYAWKSRLTEQAEAVGRESLDAALGSLAAEIPSEGEQRVAVFNSLSYPVSEVVEIGIGGDSKNSSVHVVDVQSGGEVPSRAVASAKSMRVQFHADEVPPLGYRSYRIVRRAGQPIGKSVSADADTRTLQNRYYRLRLASDGSVASLLDKELGRELIDSQSPYRGNQFIFKDDAWKDASPGAALCRAVNLGSLGATLEVRAEPTTIVPAIVTRYTLHAGLKRLDIENRLTKEPGKSGSNETVFYAFPFAVPQGRFFLDIPGVVARYPEDFRPETDWSIMPAQSFVAVANEEVTTLVATREAPNFEFSAMRKFFDHPARPDLSATTIFAQPLTKQSVNRDDYDLEGGTYVFHYAITSRGGPFQPTEAVRFAKGFQRGLLPVMLPQGNGTLPTQASFVTVESDRVVLSALKKADDGRGVIVRLWNPSDVAQTARLVFPGSRIVSATATDVLERDLGRNYEVRDRAAIVPCGAKQFVTLRLGVADLR